MQLINNDEFYLGLSEVSSPKILDFKEDFSNLNFFANGAVSKLFFVEDCPEQELQESYKYYFISNKTLKQKWTLFISDHEDNELIIKSNPGPSEKGVFRSWKVFEPICP